MDIQLFKLHSAALSFVATYTIAQPWESLDRTRLHGNDVQVLPSAWWFVLDIIASVKFVNININGRYILFRFEKFPKLQDLVL